MLNFKPKCGLDVLQIIIRDYDEILLEFVLNEGIDLINDRKINYLKYIQGSKFKIFM